MTNQSRPAVATAAPSGDSRRPAELDRLVAFIGRWITESETITEGSVQPVGITASDIYEWVAGRHFIMHPACGHIGDVPVGGSK